MKKILSILMLTAFGLGAIPMTAQTTFAKTRVPARQARHAIVVAKHKRSRKCLSDDLAARKVSVRKGKKGRKGRATRRSRKPVAPKAAPAQSVK